jgi:hypothetical protein
MLSSNHSRQVAETQRIPLVGKLKHTLLCGGSLLQGQGLQFEITNVPGDIAVPQVAVPDRGSVNHRILIAQLDFFFDVAGLYVVPEERFQVGVGYPQRVAVPTNAVAAVTRQLPVGLDLPRFRIEHKQPAPEVASMGNCPGLTTGPPPFLPPPFLVDSGRGNAGD